MRWCFFIFVLVAYVSGKLDTNTKGTCPREPPVPLGTPLATVPCELPTNPTGDQGDPACFYDQCATTGRTAMCGCVDFAPYGGSGTYWDCIDSQCQCPPTGTSVLEKCGIHGIDFQNLSFVGESPVAGYGCDLVGGRSCLCHHVVGDNDPISPWLWQCRIDAVESSATSLELTAIVLFVLHVIIN